MRIISGAEYARGRRKEHPDEAKRTLVKAWPIAMVSAGAQACDRPLRTFSPRGT
jgi:hypothetical protein